MPRSKRRASGGITPVLIALVLPLALLVVIFSVTPHDLLMGRWPLRITSQETTFYQRWFDLRSAPTDSARAEGYELRAVDDALETITDPGWHEQVFSAEGYSDTVKVRKLRSVEGGWVIKFKKDALFRTQRQVVLMPATVASIRAKYTEILATELGLLTPEVSFVHLSSNGTDLGIFLKEERIDIGFLEKRRMADGVLFTQGFNADRPDHTFPDVESDTLTGPIILAKSALGRSGTDEASAAAFVLLANMERGAGAFSSEQLLVYRWTTGRIMPLHRADRGEQAMGSANADVALTSMLGSSELRARILAQRTTLLEDSLGMTARFSAVDQAWLPVLAQGASMEEVQAIADNAKRSLFANLRVLDEAALVAQHGVQPMMAAVYFDRDSFPLHMEFEKGARGSAIAHAHHCELNGDTLTFRRGKYTFTENTVFPRGFTVVLDKGTRFFLGGGVSLLFNGPLIMRGTGVNPVFIRPLDEAHPYGTIAVHGNDSIRCEIQGLLISGGTEAHIDGLYHSGMLSIHGSDVIMDKCVISGSHGEDALNIKRGRVLITDCVFEDAHADQLDLDYTKGEVRACTFRNGREDSNGDGLDVSGAHMLIRDCHFSHLLDKGISVGEASQVLVIGCTFTENNLAMAVKDLSIAHVSDNTFTGNATVFGVYRKKPIWGGARLMLYANEFVGNTRDREVDALSKVVPMDRTDDKVWASFGANQPAPVPAVKPRKQRRK